MSPLLFKEYLPLYHKTSLAHISALCIHDSPGCFSGAGFSAGIVLVIATTSCILTWPSLKAERVSHPELKISGQDKTRNRSSFLMI